MSPVIAVVSAKGGSGKSTVACHLAVALGAALLDLDGQQAAAYWAATRAARGDVEPVPSIERHQLARQRRPVVVDTPPGRSEEADFAIRKASTVVVPVRPLGLDVRALQVTMGMLSGKRPLFVLNMVPVRGVEVDEARVALSQYGVIAAEIPMRVSMSRAMFTGLVVTEYTRDPGIADQINRLANAIRG